MFRRMCSSTKEILKSTIVTIRKDQRGAGNQKFLWFILLLYKNVTYMFTLFREGYLWWDSAAVF